MRLRHVCRIVIGGLAVAYASCLMADEERGKFPDFGFAPEKYDKPFFKLRQDYPSQLPPSAEIPAFYRNELASQEWQDYYREHWKEYLLEVRQYCFEGNWEHDWRVEANTKRAWYHMPWQHWGRFAREGLHGLTKEAAVKPRQLAATQTSGGQAYAIAFYNAFAGYLFHQVWEDPDQPKEQAIEAMGGFPHGTVIFKLLFVDIPPEQVPFLVNPTTWKAYITSSFGSEDRSIRDVHLIQMDVMMKDDRAPFGWLYGTFQYNGAMRRDNPWENLVPVGLQWGNDPDVKGDDFTNPQPTSTRINPAIRESVINADPNELPATHLGWNGRLNGPVDNPRSACMSCHMTAHFPYDADQIAPMFVKGKNYQPGSDAWMNWFRNFNCEDSFLEGRMSTDGSLQMSMSLKNFYDWKHNRGGKWHTP